MKIAVIGSGSAAMQHYSAALSLRFDVAIISKRNISDILKFESVTACEKSFKPDFYIIANNTNMHFSTYLEIRKWNSEVPVLCEKPFYFPEDAVTDSKLKIGLNLRFNPIISHLKANRNLYKGKIHSVSIEYGRDLRTWRKGGLRANSYSLSNELGGGVLRDLCHELDFLVYLFGKPNRLVSYGGSFTNLTQNSLDIFEILLTSENYDVARIHLDYVSPIPFRNIRIIGKDLHILADLINNTIEINGNSFFFENLDTFSLQLSKFLSDASMLPNSLHGTYLDKFIGAIELSSSSKNWVSI